MKFVLGLIAIIIISLAVYVTMGSYGKQQVQKEVSKAVEPKEPVSQAVAVEITTKKVVPMKANTSKTTSASVKEIVPEVKDNTSSEVVSNYNIAYPNLGIDEERILLEVKGEAKLELDKETLQKIESEVKDTIFLKSDI